VKTNEYDDRANEIITYSSLWLKFLNLAGHYISLLRRSFLQLGAFACSEESSNYFVTHNTKTLNEIALDGQCM